VPRPRARDLACLAHDTPDLTRRVRQGIHRRRLVPGTGAGLRAEIQPARELAHDQDVDSFHHLRPERRGREQRRRHGRRPEVGVEAKRLAQREQGLLGASLAGTVIPLGPAARAQKDRLRATAERDGWFRDGVPGGIDCRSARQTLSERQPELVPAIRFAQDAHGLGDHLGADAVPGDDRDVAGTIPAHGTAPTRSRRSTYSKLSTSACQDASTTFSETPTVPHVRVPSVDWISTRTLAAVAASAFKTRTL